MWENSICEWPLRMSKTTLNFNEVEINKNKFHTYKQPIDLNLLDAHKVITASKIEHGDKNLKGTVK